MVRASCDVLRRTDTFPSVFPLPVNRAKLSQRIALHTVAIALEGAMAFDERTSGQARERTTLAARFSDFGARARPD